MFVNNVPPASHTFDIPALLNIIFDSTDIAPDSSIKYLCEQMNRTLAWPYVVAV